ncbi:unnamed protein product [Calypogeia fissa]
MGPVSSSTLVHVRFVAENAAGLTPSSRSEGLPKRATYVSSISKKITSVACALTTIVHFRVDKLNRLAEKPSHRTAPLSGV